MKKYPIFIMMLLLSCFGYTQDVIINEASESKSKLKEANQNPTEGTYQIVLANEDVIPNVAEAVLIQVNSKRHADNVTYIIVNDYVKIKVLPFAIIRSKNFKPLKKYNYEN